MRFFQKDPRRYARVITGIIFVLFIIKGFLWLKGYQSPQLFGEAFQRVNTIHKVVALTFDDGPNPPYTDQILRVLKKHHGHATFFVLGKNVEKFPAVIPKIFSEGHEIGNHSWSHEQLIFRSLSFVRGEIEKTDHLLRQLGYPGEIYFRAPYGRKLFILPWILSSMNKKHVLFDVVPDDWDRPGTEEIAARILREVKPGSIVLCHDGDGDGVGNDRSQTVEAIDKVMTQLEKDGYRFVTISELLALER